MEQTEQLGSFISKQSFTYDEKQIYIIKTVHPGDRNPYIVMVDPLDMDDIYCVTTVDLREPLPKDFVFIKDYQQEGLAEWLIDNNILLPEKIKDVKIEYETHTIEYPCYRLNPAIEYQPFG